MAIMLEAAKSFGAKVVRDLKAHAVTLTTPKLKTAIISPETAAKLRTSFLFAGPLLARAGRASLPPPGGDAIGHRRLDTHFAGFKALGAKAVAGRKTLRFKGELKGAKILLDEASVTATENILMASVLAKGKTEIYNAASEPHIVDLANMLIAMGAKIEGSGTNRIRVEGVEKLGGCEARVGCDYIEAGSYIAAAAVTGGELKLTGIDPEPFEIIEYYREPLRFGCSPAYVDYVKTTRIPVDDMPGFMRRHIAAFGNGDNDADMLAFAGLGIAVKNASKRCLAAADYICPTNDEHGVAITIEKLLTSN